jgi:hypothetical protein
MKFFYDLTQINEYTYSLKIHGHNIIPLYQTIINMLKNAYYDNETETIIFTAENIKPLKNILFNKNDNKMGLNQCIKMIDELTKQISYLKTINYGFYGFDINDILVIDGIFLFCNTQYLYPLYKDNFLFIEPLSQPYFSSPEIIKLTILPTEINNKCSYYSLGVLVIFCLLNNYLLVSNELKTPEEIENIMKPIFNTKIYWFLKRCLEPNLEKRVLLLI